MLDGGVTDGGTTVGYSNDIATDDMGPGCTTYDNTGADKVFSVTIPAGQTLTATVSPVSGYDPGIYILAGPMCPALAISPRFSHKKLLFERLRKISRSPKRVAEVSRNFATGGAVRDAF